LASLLLDNPLDDIFQLARLELAIESKRLQIRKHFFSKDTIMLYGFIDRHAKSAKHER